MNTAIETIEKAIEQTPVTAIVVEDYQLEQMSQHEFKTFEIQVENFMRLTGWEMHVDIFNGIRTLSPPLCRSPCEPHRKSVVSRIVEPKLLGE